jgi:hypothetical protein
MGPPEPPPCDAAQRRQPEVLDNQGQPVSPAVALDASQRVVQGKVCYGVMLFSNTHALSGRDPVRGVKDTEAQKKSCHSLCLPLSLFATHAHKTCLGVTVRRPVPAPTPSSARSNSVPADAPFRFSCTGKSTHVVQPAAKAGAKVVLPYCEGLEILAASSQASDAMPRRDGVHGDAPAVGPQRPPLGGLGPHSSPPVILDLTAFYERWKKSANKIAQRMQDNVNATLSLLSGGSRRG